jgi:signal transduction histidine kinase
LGLHIVYEVVKAHGGRVDVASNAEHGTQFTVRLPKSRPPSSAA